MSRRRKHNSEEILMVPFLDILCSLIGVLVLIIVFLAVSQTTQTEGRTQEEVDRAIQYKSLNQKKKAAEEAEARPSRSSPNWRPSRRKRRPRNPRPPVCANSFGRRRLQGPE